MVATTRNIVNEVFGEVKVDPSTISPREWAEIVRRTVFNLPMQYMRGFGDLKHDFMEFDIHEAARSCERDYPVEYCNGVDGKSVFLFCGYLIHEFPSPKIVRDTLLAVNRKKEFFVVESTWKITKNNDTGFTNDTTLVLKRLKFIPANLVEAFQLPLLKDQLPGLNVLIALEQSLWNTMRELDRQLDLARSQQQHAMNQLSRLGHTTTHRL
ncbi:MAG: hypothetical protein Q7R54_01665 [bacterium]|nr:hypothetical protein [bacterium]